MCIHCTWAAVLRSVLPMRSWLCDTSEGGRCSQGLMTACSFFLQQALMVKADESCFTLPEMSPCPEVQAERVLQDR